jgi:hypothetical protein
MEEECGYGELLKWWALPMEKKVYFFSPVWNFRPDDLMKLGAYASEGEDLTTDKLIQDVRGRLSCDEEMFGDGTVKALKDIKSRQIAIYHWDQLPKPWEEGSYKSEAWEHWHHHHNAISGFPFK